MECGACVPRSALRMHDPHSIRECEPASYILTLRDARAASSSCPSRSRPFLQKLVLNSSEVSDHRAHCQHINGGSVRASRPSPSAYDQAGERARSARDMLAQVLLGRDPASEKQRE